jgi:hypothetical protein
MEEISMGEIEDSDIMKSRLFVVIASRCLCVLSTLQNINPSIMGPQNYLNSFRSLKARPKKKMSCFTSESGSCTSWRNGQRVEIRGLSARPELNGRSGEVVEVLANGRVKVKLLVLDETNWGEVQFLSVKPGNLQMASGETELVSPFDDLSLGDESRAESERSVMPTFSPVQTIWYSTSHFYAFGNSSAKRLTAFVPPEQITASILMLGCGDFRHIMFTNWCHTKAGGLLDRTCLDVVACDLRPSIMSRNVLLWKLIFDGVEANKAWMIFYSKFLDDACLQLLANTATSLLTLCGGDAPSWLAWNNSEFGRCCPFVDEKSFHLAIELWRFYTQSIPIGSSWDRKMKAHGKRLPAGSSMMFNANTAPATIPALQAMAKHDLSLRQYADGDVSVFQSVYAFPRGTRKESIACNPMMLEGPNVKDVYLHYGSEPADGFHSSLCYGPLHNTDKVLPGLVQCARPAEFRSEMLVTNAFAEFSAWYFATKERLDRHLVKIHVVVCDAFELLRVLMVLQHKESLGMVSADTYAGPQGLLTIRDDVPTVFDVIDTSNMADHCGLLNMLLSCRPLLRRRAHSTLFTENMSSFAKDATLSTMVEPWLGTDLETFSVLTGLIPMDYPTTTSYLLKDVLITKMAIAPLLFEGSNAFLRWKVFADDDEDDKLRVSLTEETFVEVFHQIYCRLFQTVLHPLNIFGSSTKALLASCYINSTPQTFAMLLSTCMHRMAILPTSHMIKALVDRIFTSKYMLQGHTNQEILAWLGYYQVVSRQTLKQDFDDAFRFFGVSWNDPHVQVLTEGREPSDSLLYVVTLLVPKEAIDEAVGDVKTPILEMAVSAAAYDNSFRNVKLQYLRSCPSADDRWSIDSLHDLSTDMERCTTVACSALVPISCLASKTPITVELRMSATMVMKEPNLMAKLGPRLVVYSGSLSDRSRVSWKRLAIGREPFADALRRSHRPFTSTDLRSVPSGEVIARAGPIALAKGRSMAPPLLTVKVEFDNASVLQRSSPTVQQLSTPNAVALVVSPSCVIHLHFPLPIDVERARIQISRTKGFINVLAIPLSLQSVPDRFAHLFVEPPPKEVSGQASSAHSGRLTLYGTPYVCLETLPEVQDGTRSRSELAEWYLKLLGVTMSSAERRAQREDSHRTGIGAWKESIALFFHHNVPEAGPPVRLFSLKGPKNGNEIVLFVNALRVEHTMDRSVVFDVAVCPLEMPWARDVVTWIMRTEPLQRREILVTAEELVFWKRILPALVEKARTEWTHRPGCEYVRTSRIPLCDNGNGEKIICSCCLGQQLDGTRFMADLKASRFTHLSRYFARAAIPAIFSLDCDMS